VHQEGGTLVVRRSERSSPNVFVRTTETKPKPNPNTNPSPNPNPTHTTKPHRRAVYAVGWWISARALYSFCFFIYLLLKSCKNICRCIGHLCCQITPYCSIGVAVLASQYQLIGRADTLQSQYQLIGRADTLHQPIGHIQPTSIYLLLKSLKNICQHISYLCLYA